MSHDFNQYDGSRKYGNQAPPGTAQWAMERAARKKAKTKPSDEQAPQEEVSGSSRRSWFRRR